MTERENFDEIVRFGNPEWIPSHAPHKEVAFFGANHENARGQGHDSPVGTSWTDIWGTGWHKDLEGVMGFPRVFPLEDLGRLDDFAFPDPDDPAVCGPICQGKAELPAGGPLSGSHRDTLWERAYMLVGMENLMVSLHTEPESVRRLLRRIMDFHIGIAKHYAAVGVSMVNLTDDHGMQDRLLLGREVFRSFFLPEYMRLIDFYKRRGVSVSFHSCGHIEPLLDDFIDMGIDILNPVQATANDLRAVRARTAGRLVLMGGVDSHIVLEGPPERIRALVKERIALLGADGGYICTPDQGLAFPPAHRAAFEEAVAEFGRLA